LYPNLTNFETEGTLSNYRKWAFNQTDLLCALGITEPDATGNRFLGSECAKKGIMKAVDIGKKVVGPIPALKGEMPLGNQIIDFDCKDNLGCDPQK